MPLKGFVYLPNGIFPEELMPDIGYVTDTVHRQLMLPSDALALILQGDHILGIGRLSPVGTFYTFERVIRVEEIELLPGDGIPISTVLPSLSTRIRHHAIQRLKYGGMVPEVTWNELQAVICQLSTSIAEYVRRANSSKDKPSWFSDRTAVARCIIEHERDAVGLSMKIAGSELASFRKWSPKAIPEPFLAGLEHIEVTEDALIQNDMGVFGNWNFSNSHGLMSRFSAVDGNSLTVINANRHSLETTLGADLIYWNHRYKSFVIVQYKRMRPPRTSGQQATYYPDSDRHLPKQVAQMKKLESGELGLPSSQQDYRLGRGFCFIKVCKPIIDFRKVSLSVGRYIGIDIWTLQEEEARNRMSPFTITMDSDNRYMTNTSFADLVGKEWIGSYGDKTNLISQYINEALSGGRSVTLAASARIP